MDGNCNSCQLLTLTATDNFGFVKMFLFLQNENYVSAGSEFCLKEECYITFKGESSSLNKGSEIFNTSRHRLRDLLVNVES